MSDQIHCEIHGEGDETFVCSHLIGSTAGLGFNRDEASPDNPFPDAWCDDCELIREAHGGWNEQSEKVASIRLLCSGCYERARIRNSRTRGTLDDLEDLRWKCWSCEEWHTGPCLDFGFSAPAYWQVEHDDVAENASSVEDAEYAPTFLNEDYCAINNEDFFVRGNIELPIIGTAKTFNWGVWGSLSRENFEACLRMTDDPGRVDLEPMFSWLSSQIDLYPDTLSLKMYAHIREPGLRPTFELEPTDHPLAQEYYNGISPARVKEIMMDRLADVE
jgi:hypothetical protein